VLPLLYNIDVSQQMFHSAIVTWQYGGDTVNGKAGLTSQVEIYRSYIEHDAYELIGTATMSDKFFIDTEVHPASRWTFPYYKVKAKNGTDEKEYGPYHVKDELDRHSAQIIHNIHVMLRNNGAIPVLIYQYAYGDITKRCPKCWDEISQMIVTSHCDKCQGTGFVTSTTDSGYYSPILTLADIKPATLSTTVADAASFGQLTSAILPNFPTLRVNDIIREVNTTYVWNVTQITPYKKDHHVLYQDVNLRLLNMDQIELELDIPATIKPVLSRKRARKEKVITKNIGEEVKVLEIWV
jgi:hypothetical protein